MQCSRAADPLLSLVDCIAAAVIAPMAMEEIVAEVKAYRAERRHGWLIVIQDDPAGGSTVTKIVIDLPEATAKAAHDAGLLTSETLDRLLTDAIKRRAAESLLSIADRVADQGIPPMSMEEITAEVKAVRLERRARANSH